MGNQVKTTFTGDTRPQDRAVEKLKRDLVTYQRERARDEEKLTTLLARQAEQRSRAEIRTIQRTQREIQRIRQEELRDAQRSAQIRQTGAGYILGGAAGAGYLAAQAIQKTIEQARAQRLLSASATEAGQSQAFLAEKNREFAASVGLSITAAASTTAQIARLASASGDPSKGNIDKLLKAFADLGAARGIGGNDLETLIGSILSGQDEGLNRLGIADPGQLYKAYAESVGKTTEELTQFEKVQAATNAVVEKAAIFAGAAEARMNSLEGQVAKSAATWSNFVEALASTFTTSGPVTDFINEAAKALGGLSISLDQVNKGLAQGKTPRQIAEESYPSPSFGDYATAFATGGYGIFGYIGQTGLLGETYKRATSPSAIRERRLNDLTSQIGNTATANANQATAAAEQRAAKSIATYTEQLRRIQAADVERRKLEQVDNVLGQRKPSIDQLQAGLRSLGGLGLSREKEAELQLQFINKIQAAEERAAEETKRRLDEQKKKLEEVKKAKESLFDNALSGSNNPFIQFLGKTNAEMRNLLETAKVLSPALRQAFQQQAQVQNARDLFGLRLNARSEAFELYEQADRFLGNERYPSYFTEQQRAQQRLDDQLANFRRTPGAGDNRDQIDRAIIALAGGFNEKDFRYDQNQVIGSAFQREAERKLNAEKQAVDFYTTFQALVTNGALKVSVDQGSFVDVRIDNKVPNQATATSDAVNQRYR